MKRYRWNQNGLAGNLFIGSNPSKIALALPGLPYVPGAQDYFLELIDCGYSVIQPQYIGTYDSTGTFSPDSAICTVRSTIDELAQGIYDARSQNIMISGKLDLVVAHSFGTWTAVNSLHSFSTSTPIVLLSPFFAMGRQKTDMGITIDLSDQVNYIARALPLTFRLSSPNEWLSFFNDGDYPPPMESMFANKLIICAVGSEDSAFNVEQMEEVLFKQFSKLANSFIFRVASGVGHNATEVFRSSHVMEVLRNYGKA